MSRNSYPWEVDKLVLEDGIRTVWTDMNSAPCSNKVVVWSYTIKQINYRLIKYLNKNTRAVELKKDIREYFCKPGLFITKTNKENAHACDCDKSVFVHSGCSSVVERMLRRSQFDFQHSEQKKRTRKCVYVFFTIEANQVQ